jgi:hypothetical protein
MLSVVQESSVSSATWQFPVPLRRSGHWACVDLRRDPGFGDPRRDRLFLGLTKFSQGQLGAAAEARGFDSFDMAMAG